MKKVNYKFVITLYIIISVIIISCGYYTLAKNINTVSNNTFTPNWDISLSKFSVDQIKNAKIEVLSHDKNSAYFNLQMNYENSYVYFKYTINNDGILDAELLSIVNNIDNKYFDIQIIGIKEGVTIYNGQSITGLIKITPKKDLDYSFNECSEAVKIGFNFIQK